MPTRSKEYELARVVVHFFGMITFTIASCAIIGQLTHKPMMYGWGGSGQMSTPTATCFLLNGIAWFLISRGEAHNDGSRQ